MTGRCLVYWGSHGCFLLAGHDGQHYCPRCCAEPELHRGAPDRYGCQREDHPGCAGTWPYYGSESMVGVDAALPFFRGTEDGFENMPDEWTRLAAIERSTPS